MNKTKFNLIFSIIIILFLMIFTFSAGAYVYFNNKQITKITKEDMDVEIVSKESNLTKEKQKKETEEELIEKDLEQIEINDNTEDEIEKNTDSEETEEILPVGLTIFPLPSEKRITPDELKIGFITDLHVRSSSNH